MVNKIRLLSFSSAAGQEMILHSDNLGQLTHTQEQRGDLISPEFYPSRKDLY